MIPSTHAVDPVGLANVQDFSTLIIIGRGRRLLAMANALGLDRSSPTLYDFSLEARRTVYSVPRMSGIAAEVQVSRR